MTGIVNLLYQRADIYEKAEYVQGDLVAADMRNAATWLKTAQKELTTAQEQIRVLRDALGAAKSGYELFVERFPDPNTNHEDYRVQVCRISEEATSDIEQALTATEPKKGNENG